MGPTLVNNDVPLSVNFTQVPLSCRKSYSSATARSIPGQKSTPRPPASKNGSLTRSIKIRPSRTASASFAISTMLRAATSGSAGVTVDEFHAAARYALLIFNVRRISSFTPLVHAACLDG